MLHCRSCSKMFINLKCCGTNFIFQNSWKQNVWLARFLHFTHWNHNKVNTSLKLANERKGTINFVDMMEARFKQARRSVLVQVKSDKYFSQFNDFCSKFGKINSIHNYVLPDSKLFFSLVEFKDIETLSELKLACRKSSYELPSQPYSSPFLLFHPQTKNILFKSFDNGGIITDYGVLPNEYHINNSLMSMETISDQIVKLYEITTLNDLGIRLRFLTAWQMESALSGIFPGLQCLLFGSSVNGCGRLNSDLDLVLNLNESEESTDNAPLVYQVKRKFKNDRAQLQKKLEILADFIHNFLPGCNNVIRILQARVPIIKYRHEYTGFDCDLSLTNYNAVTMSKLLYTLSNIDWRVRPLLLTVKHWAEKANVTNPCPGRWISNFSLSLVVIFYLQQIKIIPSIDDVVIFKTINAEDSDTCEVTCTFLYDNIQTFTDKNQVRTPLSDIFYGFLEYYINFDFESKGISLNSGQVLIKSNSYEPMYIVNPLDQKLNVSKNVSFEEIKNLKTKLSEAASILSKQLIEGKDSNDIWGLIPLLKVNALQKSVINFRLTSKSQVKHRLVNVSDLFNES